MRFTVFKETDFAAAHFLAQYHGKCEMLHGHNYRVRIYVGADELDSEGMVIDFVVLKQALMRVIERLDHHNLNEVEPLNQRNTTAEHVAQFIADEVAAQIDDNRVKVTECHVWETDRSGVVYRR